MTSKPPRPPGYRLLTRPLAVAVLCAGLASAPDSAAAQRISAYEQIAGQLDSQGFRITSVEKTWLGRVRIVARSAVYDREVVFVPATGEILRDYWVPRLGQPDGPAGAPTGGGGSVGDNDDDEDGYDDESDDDEDDESDDESDDEGDDESDDEDNSGSGSSGSGSDSDNSGSGSDSSGSGSGSDDDD